MNDIALPPLALALGWLRLHVPRERSRSSSGGTSKRPLRVLVVEDEYLVGLMIETILVGQGYTVTGVVDSGEEALTVAAAGKPDLVLMDIRLAGKLDGIEAARALRQLGFPTVFASAHADHALQARGVDVEPLGWLRKPFSERDLMQAVEHAVRKLGKRD